MALLRVKPQSHGVAIILTNDYSTCPKLPNLPGTTQDGHNLSDALKGLNFDVYWKKNVDSAMLNQVISEINHLKYHLVQNYRCIIFIFAGHGREGGQLYMQDGSVVSISKSIIEPLLPKNAKDIGNIPKVFLFDACRGEKETPTLSVPRSSPVPKRLPSRGGSLISTLEIPEEGNFLVAYSTMPNYKAYENGREGGVWFSTLAEQLRRGEYLYSFDDLLTEVNRIMKEGSQDSRKFQQPEKLSRLNEIVSLEVDSNGPSPPTAYPALKIPGNEKAGDLLLLKSSQARDTTAAKPRNKSSTRREAAEATTTKETQSKVSTLLGHTAKDKLEYYVKIILKKPAPFYDCEKIKRGSYRATVYAAPFGRIAGTPKRTKPEAEEDAAKMCLSRI